MEQTLKHLVAKQNALKEAYKVWNLMRTLALPVLPVPLLPLILMDLMVPWTQWREIAGASLQAIR